MMKVLPYLKGLTVQEKKTDYGIEYIEENLDSLYGISIRNNVILKVDTISVLSSIFNKFHLAIYRQELLNIIFKPYNRECISLLKKLYQDDAMFRDYVNNLYVVYTGKKEEFLYYLRYCIIYVYSSYTSLLPMIRNELVGLYNGYYYFSVKAKTNYDSTYERVSI